MPKSVFPYPGGKSKLSEWIIDNLPAHECYVEPFGGAASVLLNKPRSEVEVYNDVDDDLVQFFTVLRDRGDELKQWLRHTPFSRSLYNEWSDQFYHGEPPEDPVERAGVFFYLRYTQFGGRYQRRCGFKTGHTRNTAMPYSQKVDALDEFAERFRGVVVECESWEQIVKRYDRDETVFYLDPPYVDFADRKMYHADDPVDHECIFDVLRGIEGRFIASYRELPPVDIGNFTVAEREYNYSIDKNENDTGGTERLVMNYDPDGTPQFSSRNQATLTGAVE